MILKEAPGINRCVWNLVPEAPKSARLLPATMTRERLNLLREADHLTMEGLRRYGIYGDIWQCPTVLLPLEIDGKGSDLVVLRPIHSARAMTAVAAELPADLMAELKESILALDGVCGLGLDLTSKPPGTIEWE